MLEIFMILWGIVDLKIEEIVSILNRDVPHSEGNTHFLRKNLSIQLQITVVHSFSFV